MLVLLISILRAIPAGMARKIYIRTTFYRLNKKNP